MLFLSMLATASAFVANGELRSHWLVGSIDNGASTTFLRPFRPNMDVAVHSSTVPPTLTDVRIAIWLPWPFFFLFRCCADPAQGRCHEHEDGHPSAGCQSGVCNDAGPGCRPRVCRRQRCVHDAFVPGSDVHRLLGGAPRHLRPCYVPHRPLQPGNKLFDLRQPAPGISSINSGDGGINCAGWPCLTRNAILSPPSRPFCF